MTTKPFCYFHDAHTPAKAGIQPLTPSGCRIWFGTGEKVARIPDQVRNRGNERLPLIFEI
jgi:hypothetical protein